MRAVGAWVVTLGLLGAACVDGVTPDCSSITSGCYPSAPVDASDAAEDTQAPDAGQSDAGDAGLDVGPVADAAKD